VEKSALFLEIYGDNFVGSWGNVSEWREDIFFTQCIITERASTATAVSIICSLSSKGNDYSRVSSYKKNV